MSYAWTVVGAGAAGIGVIGKLLDSGVPPRDICWIDPEFDAGDIGAHWSCVSSNTKVGLFTKYFEAYRSLRYADCPVHLGELDPDDTCQLSHVADALRWTTGHLIETVVCCPGKVTQLTSLPDCEWLLTGPGVEVRSKKVVLAQGSEPTVLGYPNPRIPIEVALDPTKLGAQEVAGQRVAVFGSSHSAVIVIRNLLEAGATVVNFYRNPLRYALQMDGWILHDSTGLKGQTAKWARANLHTECGLALERYHSIDENVGTYLPGCDSVVYATGFQRRQLRIDDILDPDYDTQNGIIAPGVFGIGIAYPELVTDPLGHQEFHVGLFKFKNYLERVFPLWERYPG